MTPPDLLTHLAYAGLFLACGITIITCLTWLARHPADDPNELEKERRKR